MKKFKDYVLFQEATEQQVKANIPLPPAVEYLHKLFKDQGKELLIAGGAVRDWLFKMPIKDYDLATDAYPEEVMEILRSANVQHKDVGRAFGVIIAVIDKEDYEIATFRQDVSMGRRPEVRLGVTPAEDAQRRDLTINALFYDISNREILDFVGGLKDMGYESSLDDITPEKTKITTAGEPWDRFNEDPLRILRYVRFFSRYRPDGPDKVPENVREAAKHFIDNGLQSTAADTTGVTPERIKDEFEKGLKSAISPTMYLKIYDEIGLLTRYVFPGLAMDHSSLPNIGVDEQTKIPFLAMLLRKNGPAQVQSILHERKYPVKDIKGITFLLELLGFTREALAQDNRLLLNLKKRQQIANVPDEIVHEWANWNGLDPELIQYFLEYTPKTAREIYASRGEEVPHGPQVGREITKQNVTDFHKLAGIEDIPSFEEYVTARDII